MVYKEIQVGYTNLFLCEKWQILQRNVFSKNFLMKLLLLFSKTKVIDLLLTNIFLRIVNSATIHLLHNKIRFKSIFFNILIRPEISSTPSLYYFNYSDPIFQRYKLGVKYSLILKESNKLKVFTASIKRCRGKQIIL